MNVDVAVVGGGLVGATLACALGRLGLSVAIIEPKPAAETPVGGYSPRVSAVTRGAERLLTQLGVWRLIPVERLGVFREMHVWDTPGLGEIHFDSAEIAEACLGHIVENSVLQYALERRLDDISTVSWQRGVGLRELSIGDEGVRLELDDGCVQARLVAGADGANSRLRQLAGIAVQRGDYGQHAVVAVVRSQGSHLNTAWQRFLTSGPLALLPLPDPFSCVVWSTDATHAEALLEMSKSAFSDALEIAFEARVGGFSCESRRAKFPLRWLHAERYVGERVVLLGDAAHTIHPLAGQGVNLGFYDVGVLADVLERAIARRGCYWSRQVLRPYERSRRSHNAMMQNTMTGFFWLFGSSWPGLRGLRTAGLGMVDRMTPIKRLIMRHASGLEGDLPPLARNS